MNDDGTSAKTIRDPHATVSATRLHAPPWGWIRRTVAELAKPPRVARRRVRPPTVDDVQTVIVAAEERNS
jgi:hypothetical protein